jgi:4-hydroxyphenylacetate 3-monooxygenase
MTAHVRTGTEYLQALRDGREVYLDGKRVEDVTHEPGLSTLAETFARMYDLAHEPEHAAALTFEDESGQRVNGAWIEPRTRAELEWRRHLTEFIARRTGGLFGRQPDYVSLFYLGMLDIRRDFSQGNADCERNIETYWRYVRDNDLALSHGFIDPQINPSTPLERSPLIQVVGRNQEGVVVRGVKSVATFATHADEVFVGSLPRAGLSVQHIVYFAVPIATPGLRVVARTDHSVGSAFDHPVSAYGDENDCMLIFDDVLVPWERVFSLEGDTNFCLTVFPRITEWAHWNILPRLAVKAEVLVGLISLLPALIGRDKTPQVQEAVGEAIRYLTTLRAFIRAAEDNGQLSGSGYWMPDPIFVTAGRAYSVEHYRRIVGLLQDVGSQSLVNIPTEGTFDSPVVGPVLEEMLASRQASARDRARVTRLAIDLAADSYGGRQTLFELFNALPWTNQRDQLVLRYDLDPYKQLALATAGVGSLDAAASAVGASLAGAATDYSAVGDMYGKRWSGATPPGATPAAAAR